MVTEIAKSGGADSLGPLASESTAPKPVAVVDSAEMITPVDDFLNSLAVDGEGDALVAEESSSTAKQQMVDAEADALDTDRMKRFEMFGGLEELGEAAKKGDSNAAKLLQMRAKQPNLLQQAMENVAQLQDSYEAQAEGEDGDNPKNKKEKLALADKHYRVLTEMLTTAKKAAPQLAAQAKEELLVAIKGMENVAATVKRQITTAQNNEEGALAKIFKNLFQPKTAKPTKALTGPQFTLKGGELVKDASGKLIKTANGQPPTSKPVNPKVKPAVRQGDAPKIVKASTSSDSPPAAKAKEPAAVDRQVLTSSSLVTQVVGEQVAQQRLDSKKKKDEELKGLWQSGQEVLAETDSKTAQQRGAVFVFGVQKFYEKLRRGGQQMLGVQLTGEEAKLTGPQGEAVSSIDAGTVKAHEVMTTKPGDDGFAQLTSDFKKTLGLPQEELQPDMPIGEKYVYGRVHNRLPIGHPDRPLHAGEFQIGRQDA